MIDIQTTHHLQDRLQGLICLLILILMGGIGTEKALGEAEVFSSDRITSSQMVFISTNETVLNDFWIGKYEVTFGEFDEFCRETGYYKDRYTADRPYDYWDWNSILAELDGDYPQEHQGSNTPRPPTWDNHPVMRVCWIDAMAYCLWLEGKTGIPYRLPTVKEWETACGMDEFENSQELQQYAWFKDNIIHPNRGYAQTHPVGSKLPNRFGIYDMLGNVWEWCLDGPDDGSSDKVLAEWKRIRTQLNYLNMTMTSQDAYKLWHPLDSQKYLCGGAFNDFMNRVSCDFHMKYWPNYCNIRAGFRLACSADEYKSPIENTQ